MVAETKQVPEGNDCYCMAALKIPIERQKDLQPNESPTFSLDVPDAELIGLYVFTDNGRKEHNKIYQKHRKEVYSSRDLVQWRAIADRVHFHARANKQA